MNPVTLVTMFHNDVDYLPQLLENVRGIFAECVFIDAGQEGPSIDGSIDMIQGEGHRVVYRKFDFDWGATKNFGLEQVKTKWRMILDTDEYISRGIKDLIRDFSCTDYRVCFEFFRDNFMDGGGLDDNPLDFHVRLFSDRVVYVGANHEHPNSEGLNVTRFLGGRIYHKKDNYRQARNNLVTELSMRGCKEMPLNKGAFWDDEIKKLHLVNLLPNRVIEWTNEYLDGPFLNV